MKEMYGTSNPLHDHENEGGDQDADFNLVSPLLGPKEPVIDGKEALKIRDKLISQYSDNLGLILGLIWFTISTLFAYKQESLKSFQDGKYWAIGGLGLGGLTILFMYYAIYGSLRFFDKSMYIQHVQFRNREKYGPLFIYPLSVILALVARYIGITETMKQVGLNAAFWGLILGLLVNVVNNFYTFIPTFKMELNAECFIKLGVILLATNFESIAEVGLRTVLIHAPFPLCSLICYRLAPEVLLLPGQTLSL